MQAYLVGRTIGIGCAEMARLPLRAALPLAGLGRQSRVLALQLAAAAVLFALNPAAARTSLARLFHPWRDVPPFSTLTFHVIPDAPSVIYGGAIELACSIDGASDDAPVWCLTRTRGRIHRAACFQDAARRYTQRLDRVVASAEFCFARGRARSRWHRVSVLLHPDIAGATATITPPDYTGLTPRRIVPGRDAIEGYRNSRIELRVTSNRPLKDGVVSILPRGDAASVRTVAGVLVGADALAFEWDLATEASLDVTVRDVRGTTNRAPWRLRQKLIADEAPVIAMMEPPPFSLATTGAVLKVVAEVTDDLGLRNADMVRTLVGYRDRSHRLSVGMGARRTAVEHPFRLQTLGVQSGQVLEFHVEASDGNPELTSLTVSDIARVRIISDDEYAVMVRARTALEDFTGRFSAAGDSIEALVRSMEALRSWAGGGASQMGAAGTARFSTLTREQVLGYLRDLLSDNRDRTVRALHMLENGGATVIPIVNEHLAANPDLAPGARNRLKEVWYTLCLKGRGALDAPAVARKLLHGSLVVERLADPDAFVRFTAVKALTTISAKRSLPRLESLFVKEDELKAPIAA